MFIEMGYKISQVFQVRYYYVHHIFKQGLKLAPNSRRICKRSERLMRVETSQRITKDAGIIYLRTCCDERELWKITGKLWNYDNKT